MRVFVTGATGFIGTAVVKELLSAGHTVLGLTRSDKGAEQLKTQGAEVIFGTLEEPETLKKGAAESDAVVHLAFIHDFTNYDGACATDRAAITAMGSVLAAAGGNRPLVVTSGTMMLTDGKLGAEGDAIAAENPMAAARGASERVALDFTKQGVNASVVRLPPTTHGPGTSGFSGMLAKIALEKGVSAYVGDGQNRWSAGHRDDAAKVYRLAVEKGKPGSVFHAVAEEGVPLKELATAVGKQLNVPVVSISPEKAAEHFGWFQFPAMADNIISSEKTKEQLGWSPTEATVIEDIPTIVEYMKNLDG